MNLWTQKVLLKLEEHVSLIQQRLDSMDLTLEALAEEIEELRRDGIKKPPADTDGPGAQAR